MVDARGILLGALAMACLVFLTAQVTSIWPSGKVSFTPDDATEWESTPPTTAEAALEQSRWPQCTKTQMDGDTCPGILTPAEGDLIVRSDGPATEAVDLCASTATPATVQVRCIYHEGIWRQLDAVNLGDIDATSLASIVSDGITEDEYSTIIWTRDNAAKADSLGMVMGCPSSDNKCTQLQIRRYEGTRVWSMSQNIDGTANLQGYDASGTTVIRLSADGKSQWQQYVYNDVGTVTLGNNQLYGAIINNGGAGAATTYTLPPMLVGMSATICVETAEIVTIDPDGTERFLAPATDTNGDYLRNAGTVGDCISFVCVVVGEIRVTGSIGTWTEE